MYRYINKRGLFGVSITSKFKSNPERVVSAGLDIEKRHELYACGCTENAAAVLKERMGMTKITLNLLTD